MAFPSIFMTVPQAAQRPTEGLPERFWNGSYNFLFESDRYEIGKREKTVLKKRVERKGRECVWQSMV